MSTVIDALAGLKAAFLTIAPPTGSLGSRVWAWPADRSSVSYATFPFILCAQVLNENGVWREETKGGGSSHVWPAEVLVCLNNETVRDDVSADDEAAAQAWLLAIAGIFFGNRSLGGTALDIGPPDSLLTTQIGNMGWFPTRTFWGVYCRTRVTQYHNLPTL